MANLFTSQTPSVTDASDGTPGIATSTTMRFATAGSVSGIRFYATTTVSGTYTAQLYSVDAADVPTGAGTLLASKVAGAAPTGGTWNTVTFDTPVSVTADTVLYRAVIHSDAGRYVATVGFFSVELINGDITADANGADPVGLGTLRNGTFAISATPTYPASGGGTSYFVDVDFTPGGDVTVSPDGIAVPVSLGTPTVSSAGLAVAPDGIGITVTLGRPTVSTPGAPTTGGWSDLSGVIESARQDARLNRERERNPIDCPEHGWPLDRRDNILHCLFGGHTVRGR